MQCGLSFISNKLRMPAAKRCEGLAQLHAAHRDAERTIARARHADGCPCVKSVIKRLVMPCCTCQKFKPKMRSSPYFTTRSPIFRCKYDLYSNNGSECLLLVYFCYYFTKSFCFDKLRRVRLRPYTCQQFRDFGRPMGSGSWER